MGVIKTETVVDAALAPATAEVQEVLRESPGDRAAGSTGARAAVVPVGSGTRSEVGDPIVVSGGGLREVRAPAGIVSHDVADMTVTLGAGTTAGDLERALSAERQECPLDAHSVHETVGGLLAAGLSGFRRLRHGPLRDSLLEVRFVTGDGRLVQGGGPTVKNVSGYDLPRLLVGSLGTLGVIVQVTLRCRPLPEAAEWFAYDARPSGLSGVLFAPSALLWDGQRVHVLLEGHPDDIAEQVAAAGLKHAGAALPWPSGPHRGRISVPPGALEEVGGRLQTIEGCTWLGEIGVGTVHVGCDTEAALSAARAAATGCGGWMLREAGAPGLAGFGCEAPNAEVMRRIKQAFDPAGVLAPGRIPL